MAGGVPGGVIWELREGNRGWGIGNTTQACGMRPQT